MAIWRKNRGSGTPAAEASTDAAPEPESLPEETSSEPALASETAPSEGLALDEAAALPGDAAEEPSEEAPAGLPASDGSSEEGTSDDGALPVAGDDEQPVAGDDPQDPSREEAEPAVVSVDTDAPEDAPSETSAPRPEPVSDGVRLDDLPAKPMRELPRVMAVANQKGGVGKTTTTVNLGAGLAELGYRVLVIDLDPQGNATTGLGIERKNFEHSMYDVIMRDQPLEDCIEPTSVKNLFVAPATLDLSGVEIELVPAFSRELRLKRALEPIIEEFDFVMIDCPPSLGLITINALAAADEVLVPIQCEYYALEGLSQLRSTLKLVSGNLNQELELSTIVLTMYDARTRLAAEVAADVAAHFPHEVCTTIIPRTVRLSEAPSFGQPITTFDPTSRGAQAYRDLAKEVSNGAPKRAG